MHTSRSQPTPRNVYFALHNQDQRSKMHYGANFAALALFNAALYYHQDRNEEHEAAEESIALPKENGQTAASKFKWEYFGPYSLVMAADWLQVRPYAKSMTVELSPTG